MHSNVLKESPQRSVLGLLQHMRICYGQETLNTSFARSSMFKGRLNARYPACTALEGEARCRWVGLACCTKDVDIAHVPDKAEALGT